MPSPSQTETQINELVGYLVHIGLVDRQRPTFQKTVDGNLCQVTFEGSEHVQFALKNFSYDKIYRYLVQARAYNVKMLDGALIQMMYEFAGRTLQRHRLAFFSAPHLENFQSAPKTYLEDERYADVVAKNIVRFPLRFDYGVPEADQEWGHPKSHLTLGQYKNCRIPVTAPLTPFWFIDFILRNFYHTAFAQYAERLPRHSNDFAPSILPAEQAVVHIAIPA